MMAAPISDARVVVALDFGTTFSGFAYARKLEPDKVFTFYDWPCQAKAGAKPYCKTQTSLLYVPGSGGKFHLKDWGWSALVNFTKATQGLRFSGKKDDSSGFHAACSSSTRCLEPRDIVSLVSKERSTERMDDDWVTQKVGFLVTKFKLFLVHHDCNRNVRIPLDLPVERLISDYLRCMSDFVMEELRSSYGKHFAKESVQWCITVPAIWNERTKQIMRICAQRAGLVKGAQCTASDASPHTLQIVLEPEAAAAYCQHRVTELKLRKGDRILIADVGGGTIDLVVHSKVDDDPNSLRVEEVVRSYGDLGGGTFVDAHLFEFLSAKIGCFTAFCHENPSAPLSILGWWQGIKAGFDGPGYSAELQIPGKLIAAWEEDDRRLGNTPMEDYTALELLDSDIQRMFDPEVDKVVDLVDKQIAGVRVLMVVGGFAASAYLRKVLTKKFAKKVEEIIIPNDPGSAICHGAVQLHLRADNILSRIARKSYGIAVQRPFTIFDPVRHRYIDDDGEATCDNVFDVYVRMGERVPVNHSVTKVLHPSFHGQEVLEMTLYSSTKAHPLHTDEEESVCEGSFDIDISGGLELDKERCIRVTMNFGRSSIEVSAVRENFGTADKLRMLPVSFH